KFKPLFAPLIIDLDNRINVNVHGNMRAQSPPPSSIPNTTHASNQGWGPWEVNLSYVLNELHPTKPGMFEWSNLLMRQLNPTLLGRYGSKDTPPFQNAAPTGSPYQANIASPGQFPHFYAPVDYDACNNDPLNNNLALSYPATPPFGPGFPFSTG